MPVKKYLQTALLAAFALETLCATWFLKVPGGSRIFSVLYFLAGSAIAFLLLYADPLRLPATAPHLAGKMGWNTRLNHYRLIFIGLLALAMYSWCRYWFEEIPIDIDNADMLPIIKVMGERFLAGHHKQVYEPIHSIWTGVQPIYLPAMWLPYVPAIALGLDMRCLTVAGLLFAFSVFIGLYQPEHKGYGGFLTGVLAFLLFWWLFADNTPGVITVSEEGVVIAYYVLLVLALVSGNPWLIGITASLCALSRYALVGWIPAYYFYLLLEKKGRQASIFAGTGLLCFVLLFLLPVGWSTVLRLIKLPADYVAFAARVWKDSPEVFTTGLGFAGFFGQRRIALLHGLLVTLSFLVPFLFIVICHYRARRGRNRAGKKGFSNIPLAALKMSLVIFYCFIDVPYLYLFYTSSFVSLVVVALLMAERGGRPS